MRPAAGVATRAAAAPDRDELVARLFANEGVALVRLARLFTDDRTAAEDLVQEAFVRLLRASNRIEDEAHAPAYLRSIVLNLARDHNRRGLMSLRHRDAERDERPPETEFADRIVADTAQAALLDALRDLPPRQRDCLVLRFYVELSMPEIAEMLAISPNSVKTHCRRGLAALRDRVEEAAT